MENATDCIFCRVAAKKLPAQLLYEDHDVVAFQDINPQAPTHILVISKKHIPSIAQVSPEDKNLLGQLVWVGQKMAADLNLVRNGFRMVMNTGANAGQTVFHMHLHVLGGRSFSWPPG